jgi:hypothetical protein
LSLQLFALGRWVIENQIGKKDLIIEKCDAWQSVYIYGCKDSVIQIHGKWEKAEPHYVLLSL